MEQELKQLIIENQNLIYSLTKYFTNYQGKEDLFQVGCMGLIKAYRKFDDQMGTKFTTYAYPYILGEMRKLVREDKGIKISRDISKLNLKIEKASILLSQKLMREPTLTEISQFLEIPECLLVDALKSIHVLQSIDEPMSNEGKVITLHDSIKDPNEMDYDSLITLREELNSLTPFERSLIETRYMRDMTQSETAKELGISQVQVSRKEQKVLSKLRNNMVA